MYRENEAGRVGAVLAAKVAGDGSAAVDAAIRLWLSPVEDPSRPDEAAAEVWAALGELGALPAALAAALRLIRERTTLRPHVIVDVVESIANVDTLLELAAMDLVTYAPPVFARLIDLRAETPLARFIVSHHDQLHAELATWVLVGYTITSSRVGNTRFVHQWFHGWQHRTGAPMWLLAAFAATIAELEGDHWAWLASHARLVLDHAVPDETAGYFHTYLLVDTLHSLGAAELATWLPEVLELLRDHAAAPYTEHPLVRYANRVRHRRPFREPDFAFARDRVRPPTLLPRTGDGSPRVLRFAELVHYLKYKSDRAAIILPMFAELHAIERGHPRAGELYFEMQAAQLPWFPQLVPVWHRLLRSRVRWRTWLKMQVT